MTTLGWILVSGVSMSLLALSGVVTLALPAKMFNRTVLPMVALAAGALLGGALFHMLPNAVSQMPEGLAPYLWLVAGLFTFFLLEQFLNWHHCHRPVSEHRPLGWMILVADGLHNLFGGLAVGSAFVIDIRLGVVTWLVAAAHEIPQEIGDFGILIHSGWRKGPALVYNMLSALTFLVGSVVAYLLAADLSVVALLPFAAGNFLYIALADLFPELTTDRSPHERVVLTVGVAAGLALLWGVATIS